ncbi:MAG: hypothetical protein IPM60_15470 [Rhodospirillales bacterium]|nr:hypothetical protein [Rhodospirillales bacterium]
MTALDELITDTLAAADGEIVNTWLQKIFYLLEQAGMKSGVAYHYHHYGPYSRQLDEALDRAQALHSIQEKIAYRQTDGMPYSIFSLHKEEGSGGSEKMGKLPFEEARELVAAMKTQSSTVLELAATIHWLDKVEKKSDWKRELIRRKGMKTEHGRMEEAVALLKRLRLSPDQRIP